MAGSSQSLDGETGLTTPPFFLNARRGVKTTWGVLDDSLRIVNWSGLDPSEPAEITPTLVSTDNWIIFIKPLGPEKTATPPIPTGAQQILHAKGKACRERGWYRTGTDNLASYGLDTEVWIIQDNTIANSNIPALALRVPRDLLSYVLPREDFGWTSISSLWTHIFFK